MNKHLAQCLILGCIGAMLLMSCAPSPESYASATATILRASNIATQDAQANSAVATAKAGESYATATAVALSVQATSTSITWQARATETFWQVSVDATATAVPFNAPLAVTRTQTTQANQWLGVLMGLAFLVGVVMLVISINLFIRNRAAQIPRDATGQLPMVYRDGVFVDPARMIGPALVMPQNPGLLWNIRRLIVYARTGHLEALPPPHLTLTDANASPDQLLAAAQSAQLTAGIAAMFQPGISTDERMARLQVADRAVRQNLPLAPTTPNIPTPRVIVQGNDAIEAIARVMGDRLPALDAPTELPIDLSPSTDESVSHSIVSEPGNIE
jgi:hypothetical protein